ncbi:NAD-dependent epimerase/dehydratase family protein [Agromyces fucosus]|uniref:NAD-dependent epimerase/dehydratase family protein n=1 Tax=Agromyces fucosus TaxID=41985 RepID=A0A4Q2JUL7_9MICO|nr:NAD-dependent epimerase/dehydratase family protein [Agromyces fucosus]
MTTYARVIGARGLLGSALRRAIDGRRGWTDAGAAPLPWHDDASLVSAARDSTHDLLDRVGENDHWTIIWAAGASVTASSPESLASERHQLELVLATIAAVANDLGLAGRGTFFYPSSAGGIYAGSEHPPFTESTVPAPIAPYGWYKLSCEASTAAFAESSGVAVLNGRIANLFGPGQRLDKMQGLISHLALAQLSPQPASIFVSLDTLRDYIYVDDCAALILDALDRLRIESAERRGLVITKNLASGRAVTIADLLGYFRLLSKGHPHVMLGNSPASSLQARDLRLGSEVWPDLDRRDLTPLPVGIHATIDDIRFRLQEPGRVSPR